MCCAETDSSSSLTGYNGAHEFFILPSSPFRFLAFQFTVQDMDAATGSSTTISDNKAKVLMARMRYPSLSLHGIEVRADGANEMLALQRLI